MLCRPGWPWTHRDVLALCLLSVGNKGMCHQAKLLLICAIQIEGTNFPTRRKLLCQIILGYCIGPICFICRLELELVYQDHLANLTELYVNIYLIFLCCPQNFILACLGLFQGSLKCLSEELQKNITFVVYNECCTKE